MKQVVAIFLIVAMLFSLIPSTAIAFAEDFSLADIQPNVEETILDVPARDEASVVPLHDAQKRDDVKNTTHLVTLNVNNATFNRDLTYYVEYGQSFREPVMQPFKRYNKFKYWSYNGGKYDFSTPVTQDITLVAEFESLPWKNGHGFEVYLIDASTNKSVRLNTKVEMSGKILDNSAINWIDEMQYDIRMQPTLEEITSSLGGRKFVGIKEYRVRIDGNYSLIGGEVNHTFTPLKAFDIVRDDNHQSGPYFQFSTKVGYANKRLHDGPHDGQVEGGVIEIVVNTEEARMHNVKLNLAGGVFFKTERLDYIVENNGLFAQPVEAPFKKGSLFIGWYVGDQEYDFTQAITNDLTLTAKYQEIQNFEQVTLQLELPDGRIVPVPGMVFTHTKKEFAFGTSRFATYTYSISIEKQQIQDIIGKKWTLKDVKGRKVDLKGNANIGTGLTVQDKKITLIKDDTKVDFTFEIMISAEKGQIENGVATLVLDVEKSASHTVTFDAMDAKFFDAASVIVRDGESVSEPARIPLKRGYRFLHWSLQGQKYDFNQAVTDDIVLTAVFEKLDNKNGFGFEVVVVDAKTKERVKLQTKVVRESSVHETPFYRESVDTFGLYPAISEIESAFAGKKLLGIEKLNVTVDGHYLTKWKNEKNPIGLAAGKLRIYEDNKPNVRLFFEVRYTDDERDEFEGPHYGQIEGGVVEIVVNLVDDDERLVTYDANDSMHFEARKKRLFKEQR